MRFASKSSRAVVLAGALLGSASLLAPPFPHLESVPASRRPGSFRAADDETPQGVKVGAVERWSVDGAVGGVPPGRRRFPYISSGRMLADLRELSAIGGAGLFRTSGSRGEREAFDWLESRLRSLPALEALGATVERHPFRLPFAVEVRRAELAITVSGREFDVPVHGLQGHREDLTRALRFDSDGVANDDAPDPVGSSGPAVILRGASAVSALAPRELRGRIAFVDFALLDTGVLTSSAAAQTATLLLRAEPAALVLVTRYRNLRGESHGSFAGDLSAFVNLSTPAPVPTVLVRLEDLAAAGIRGEDELGLVTAARVTWDADLFSPAASEYLVLRIPGEDGSRAVLLGAHLDSANSPGAMDDGSGVVVLLEAARSVGESRSAPPADVYFLWFGSHERGLYGSAVFAQANAGLLRRAVGMLQVDCLTHPLDGLPGELVLEAASYRPFGDARLPFLETLQRHAAALGVSLGIVEVTGTVSDNSSFSAFGVPNADAIWLSEGMSEVHVEGHLHDPYDDMPLAELHGRELSDMTAVALAAALDVPGEKAEFRVTPPPAFRALFVASHTEAVQMTPAHLSVFGMTLSFEGWAVDVVPYGRAVTDADLVGADLVVVLPVVDYPVSFAPPEPYDESWSWEEVQALRRYAEGGGFLVLTGSATRLRYGTTPMEPNEDALDVNAVGGGLGVVYLDRRITGTYAFPERSHPLVEGISWLTLASGNGLALQVPEGTALARSNADVAAALVGVGVQGGEVLALADLSILGGSGPSPPNLAFWQNLARFAKTRRSR
jgi:hypothetical protein